MKPVFRFSYIQVVYLKIILVRRIKRYYFLSTSLSRKHRATNNVSNAHTSRRRQYRLPIFSNIRPRTFDTSHRRGDIIPVLPRCRCATKRQQRTRARGSCELKDHTVINNRFLSAPVYAAPSTASTQGEIFSSRFARGGQGGGENVGHKNVPIRNGHSEERTRRVRLFAGDRTFGMASQSPVPCIVGMHRPPLVYTGTLYGVGRASTGRTGADLASSGQRRKRSSYRGGKGLGGGRRPDG